MYRKIWWNTVLFFVLSMSALVILSALDIFLFEHYAPKLGGQWGMFWIALLISLLGVGLSAGGYVVAVGALESKFSQLSPVERFSVAFFATMGLIVAFATDSIEWISEVLPFESFTVGVVSLLIVGALVGGFTLYIVHWCIYERRST